MPRLSFLLSDQVVSKLRGELDAISISLYEDSFSEQRHVRRIPLKPQAVNLEEERYIAQSFDGLSAFRAC